MKSQAEAQGQGSGRAAIASLRERLVTFQKDYAGAIRLGVGRHPERIDLTLSDIPAFLKKPVARLTILPRENGSFILVDKRRDQRCYDVKPWCETEHLVMQQVRNVAATVALKGRGLPYEFPAWNQLLPPVLLLLLAGVAGVLLSRAG